MAAAFKQNIWVLHRLIGLFSLIVFAWFCYGAWKDTAMHFENKQSENVQILSNGVKSTLVGKETIIRFIADNMIELNGALDPESSTESLRKIAETSPHMSAIAIADSKGNIIIADKKDSLILGSNIIIDEKYRDLAIKSMETSDMEIGTTSHFEFLDSMALPVMTSVRKNDGSIIGFILIYLHINAKGELFEMQMEDRYDSGISFVNENGQILYITDPEKMNFSKSQWVQYYKNDAVTFSQAYFGALQEMAINTGLSKLELFNKDKPTTGYFEGMGFDVQYAAKYLKDYDIWVASTMDVSIVNEEFVRKIIPYFALYLFLHFVFYGLVKSLANSEKEIQEELLYQANCDALTMLPNRQFLRREIDGWTKEDSTFSLMFIDLDRFKSINDSNGHTVGDMILSKVATRLEKLTFESSLLARETGDEFVILTEIIDDDTLGKESELIISELSKPYQIGSDTFVLGCSIGIAKYPIHGKTLKELMLNADIAMHHAKEERNAYRIFDESMSEGRIRKILIEQRLRIALAENKIWMAYQPQVDKEGRLHGVEALVRWIDDELDFVPPDEFIKVAEDAGIIHELGERINSLVLRDMTKLQNELKIRFQTSINISVKQINHSKFIGDLEAIIESTGYDPKYLTLEITESLFASNTGEIESKLDILRAKGIRISLDDFGTGYSSLSMLNSIAIDELKIDKSFIDNILSDEQASRMAQSIVSLGKNFNMTVLAEGVETTDHHGRLIEMGCDLFQGYSFARPLKFNDLVQYLQEAE